MFFSSMLLSMVSSSISCLVCCFFSSSFSPPTIIAQIFQLFYLSSSNIFPKLFTSYPIQFILKWFNPLRMGDPFFTGKAGKTTLFGNKRAEYDFWNILSTKMQQNGVAVKYMLKELLSQYLHFNYFIYSFVSSP